MTVDAFKALVVTAGEGKTYLRQIERRTVDDLPDGDVLIQVHYSSLNYKDALSASGNKGVTRSFPHTPGIDAAGTVADSRVDAFKKGDPVLVTSYDLGMNTSGGFGQYVRVPAGWVVPLPAGLSLKESMIYGTAGFTAGMGILFLTERVKPEDGPVLVTGATGGVGSVAVAVLAKLGYTVAAVTGKTAEAAFLKGIGASQIVDRADAADTSGRPLLKSQWAGVVDTVGGRDPGHRHQVHPPLGHRYLLRQRGLAGPSADRFSFYPARRPTGRHRLAELPHGCPAQGVEEPGRRLEDRWPPRPVQGNYPRRAERQHRPDPQGAAEGQGRGQPGRMIRR
jgi:putative YhdH/YhfP family quinone oxidoreductase